MRKRGKHRNRVPATSPVELAVRNGNSIYEQSLNKLRNVELAAIDAFARGQAREQEWHDINALTGICMRAAKAGIGIEAIEACEIAREHLRNDYLRFQATGKMGTTEPGLTAYRDVFAYMDLQRQSITEAQYHAIIQKTIRNLKVTN